MNIEPLERARALDLGPVRSRTLTFATLDNCCFRTKSPIQTFMPLTDVSQPARNDGKRTDASMFDHSSSLLGLDGADSRQ